MQLACHLCTRKAQIECIMRTVFFCGSIYTKDYFYSFQISSVTLFEDPIGILGLYFRSENNFKQSWQQ